MATTRRTDEFYSSQTPYYGANGSAGVSGFYDTLEGFYEKPLDTTGQELTHSQTWVGNGTNATITIENGGCLDNRYELWAITTFGGAKNTIRMFSVLHVLETSTTEGVADPKTIVTALTPIGVWNTGITYLLNYRPAVMPVSEV